MTSLKSFVSRKYVRLNGKRALISKKLLLRNERSKMSDIYLIYLIIFIRFLIKLIDKILPN